MKLEEVVPWGRDLSEYKDMFLLSNSDLSSSILSCGDCPASFNCQLTDLQGEVVSVDPIYQFSKDEIAQRIDETASIVSQELKEHQDDFVWKNIKSVDALIKMRLASMQNFLDDYEAGKKAQRYINGSLPKLSFDNDSFDLVLSSHFLFLYSQHFDLQFHSDAILEMCRVSKKEVRIFPLVDLSNKRSRHLEDIIKLLDVKGFSSEIVKSHYEFQKNANEMLVIDCRDKAKDTV